jgi:hypothetical protein
MDATPPKDVTIQDGDVWFSKGSEDEKEGEVLEGDSSLHIEGLLMS